MGNIIESVQDFFHESMGRTDYELSMKGIKAELAEKGEGEEEFSSLLRNTGDDSVKRFLPAIMHPFRMENYGIAVSYFNTGICLFILITPVTYYFINTLGASAGQVNAFVTLVYLPWSMKIIFGILTDTVVIFGYRRKSWMLIGWVMYCLLNSLVAFFERPGLILVTSILFFSSVSYLQADVCNDAQSIERSKFEPVELKGSYQTAMYTVRGFGMIISSIQATILYNTSSFGWGLSLPQLFWLSVLIPATTVIPFIYFIVEVETKRPPPSFLGSLLKIWEVLQLKAVWYPFIFYLPYSCMQFSNSAWSNYLVLSLGFTDFELGLITISGSIAYFLGVLVFQRITFQYNWREVMVFYSVLYSITYSLQIVLFYQVNQVVGISNTAFACLLCGLQYFFVGINSMPLTMMNVMVCPDNNEGVMYAVLTTITNLAGTVALDFSTILSYGFSVTNDDLSSGKVDGMVALTLTVCIFQMLPLFLIGFSPGTRFEMQALIESKQISHFGGTVLVSYIALCLVFTLILNFSLLSY